MIKQLFVLSLVVVMALFLNAHPARKKVVRLDNLVHRTEPAKKVNFYGNPLTLNGKPLNYSMFTTSSRGLLAVVEGDPESKEATKVPFRVCLLREGAVVTPTGSDNTQPVYYDIEVSAVLALAHPGDDLVIEPARKTDIVAKRVINLRPLNSCLPPNWLFFSVSGRPGC